MKKCKVNRSIRRYVAGLERKARLKLKREREVKTFDSAYEPPRVNQMAHVERNNE